MLSGAPPFWGVAADVREAQRSRRPPRLPACLGLPPGLEEVVRRCLAKDRDDRFDDVQSLGAALDEVLASPVRTQRPSLPPPAPGSNRSLAPPAPAPPPREKRMMGLLFFESRGAVAQVQPAIAASGGQLVHASGTQCVAAFGHDVGDNPLRTAIVAGQRVLAAGLCERLLVDVAAVSVQVRPDGTSRIFSAVFTKKERFPAPGDPAGICLSAAARELVSDLGFAPVPGRPDRFRLDPGRPPEEDSTTYGTQSGALFGRDRELKLLLDGARVAFDRSEPTLATVLGEPGVGRTALATAVAKRLEGGVDGRQIVRITAHEGMDGAAATVLADLLRRLMDIPGAAPPDGGQAFWTDRLGPVVGEAAWAAASLILGWIPAEHPEIRRLAAAPGALRLASSRAAGEALRRTSVLRPLAVVIDDAHLADEATLDALEYATLLEGGARIWVVAFVRPAFKHGRPTWATRAAHGPVLTLSPLEGRDAAALARHLLQIEHVPATALARLADRTQGLPRLLVELVRGLKRDGLVRRHARGTGFYIVTEDLDKLPDLPLVQWNARREIEMLPVHLAGHARLASVLGGSFTASEVDAFIRILEPHDPLEDVQLDASVGIQRLVDAGLLIRHRTGLVDFRHSLLRDTIYQQLPEDRRQRFHRAAFEMYRAATTLSVEQRLARLAHHAARSGAREEAVPAYLELAERRAQTHAYLEAEHAYTGALENLGEATDARVVRASRGRGSTRLRLNRYEDALKDLRYARERAHAAGDVDEEIAILLDEATVQDWQGDYAGAAEVVVRAEGLASALSPLTAARLLMSRGRMLTRREEADAASRLLSQGAASAEQLGAAGYETLVICLIMLASNCCSIGRLEEAEAQFDKVLLVAESRGDLMHVAAAMCNRAFLWNVRGEPERMLADLGGAVRIAREIGLGALEWVGTRNLAETEYVIERLDAATAHAQRASELAQQLSGPDSSPALVSDLTLARVALVREDAVEAKRLAERIRVATEAGANLEPPEQMMLAAVELAARGGTPEEWTALLERADATGMQPADQVEILDFAAIAAARAGDLEVAKTRLEKALKLSSEKPNLLSARVERRYAQMFASASPGAIG
jgi:tetratricopeptide (TPR) repeat protein